MQGLQQGLQVPTWLGVLLVLAVPAGTVLGAWWGHRTAARTAAARDDARWERERDREEIRYQRELERVNTQREHDARVAWRSERLAAYTTFLEKYDAWRQVVFYMDLNSVEDLKNVIFDEEIFSARYSECARAAEGLELLCSKTMSEYTSKMLPEMFRLSRQTVQAKRYADEGMLIASRLGNQLHDLDVLRDRIRDAARADLLTDPVRP